MDYIITRADNSDELMHYGVLGMKWGVHRSRSYEKEQQRHIAKANKLQDKADKKRNSFMNTPSRKIKYAVKEQRYANAEKFHNQKANGLSYFSKLTGSTLDYKYNKSRAAKDAIMKEKYSQAKAGTTNRVNRLEYRAQKQIIKANKMSYKKAVVDAKLMGKGKDAVDEILKSQLGNAIASKTWTSTSSYKDRNQTTDGFVSEHQIGR